MTDEELRAEVMRVLDYDPEMGDLSWKIRRRKINPGQKIVRTKGHGYCRVMIDGVSYLAHKLAYLMHHGWMPEVVDHINHDKTDNSAANLRACTKSGNERNTGKRSNNSSGFKGVSLRKGTGKYEVRVMVYGRCQYFGLYSDIELAELVASEARAKYHGDFACD